MEMSTAMSEAQALTTFVQLAADESRTRTQVVNRTVDVKIVTEIEDGRVLVQPIGGGTSERLSILKHVDCEVGDEVLVQRIGRRWLITGVISATMGGS